MDWAKTTTIRDEKLLSLWIRCNLYWRFDGISIMVWLSKLTKADESWWRHQMETFSALLAICAGNSPVTGEFPTQRPVTRSFDVYFDLRLNNRLSKQSWGWWFETLSSPSWRHRNDNGDMFMLHCYHSQFRKTAWCFLGPGVITTNCGAASCRNDTIFCWTLMQTSLVTGAAAGCHNDNLWCRKLSSRHALFSVEPWFKLGRYRWHRMLSWRQPVVPPVLILTLYFLLNLRHWRLVNWPDQRP